ncbi:hypothetical protein [Calorimonas adulescens]|uniref:VCBS repeat-containing protein n=1 Tax=Calorimonas adulescens TaxID=2606906 RepID=A0A5D8Q934_9THEO|nr:hypothetical protein [Calorimonas adulescens]TZE81031.1 hypothetical protein FWJ32_11050 [Calorimonas adulescens]
MKKILSIAILVITFILFYLRAAPFKYLYKDDVAVFMWGHGFWAKGTNIQEYVSDGLMKDITTDGDYIYYITGEKKGKYGDKLYIFNLSAGRKIKEVYMPDRMPWKIDSGDVDGDGKTDILVLMYKKTLFDPVLDNRPFVYTFDGHLYAKWLGSRLSHPILDAHFKDVDGDSVDELVSLEYGRDGKKIRGIYEWDSFGFVMKNVKEMGYFK